jgi:Family of unknown function (DUF6011)
MEAVTMSESGYENAPATRMLATQCAVCGRPLVDSVSVETGIGPDCRRKHGYTVDVSDDARKAGNAIVYAIAAGAHDGPALAGALASLRALGFVTLADTIARRRLDPEIEISEADGCLTVRAPYRAGAMGAWRAIPGRRWDSEAKVNTVPTTARAALWALLRAFYAGAVGIGPRGPFTVADAS